MKHSELVKIALARPGVKAAYDALAPEFELLHEMLAARSRAGLSQADVAQRMGTHAPSVGRLESALRSAKHSPSINTLKRYAKAVGCELQIRFVAMRRRASSSARTPKPSKK